MRRKRGLRPLRHLGLLIGLAALVALPPDGAAALAARPAAVKGADLRGVVCATKTSCFAVGLYEGAKPLRPLVGRSNGARWSLTPGPQLPGTSVEPNGKLEGVACPTETHCFAVGYRYANSGYTALVEQWDGKRWSILPDAPSSATVSELEAIACPSRTSCFAVGLTTSGTVQSTLIERWNGTRWTVVSSPSPHPAASTFDQLDAISCPTATSCFAVGTSTYQPGSGPVLGNTIIERWNGTTWTLVKSTNAAASGLTGVSCARATTCFAVGTSSVTGGSTRKLLAERWNGTTWSIIPLPVPSPKSSTLTAISCPSANRCFAIGSAYTPDLTLVNLVEQWNGTKWSYTTFSDSFGVKPLVSISCPSDSNCVAVERMVIWTWNGKKWSALVTGPA